MELEEREYNEFVLEFTAKVNELNEKFDRLSDNNKKRFYAEIKPVIDSGSLAWLFGKRQ